MLSKNKVPTNIFAGTLNELLTRINNSKSPHADYFLNNAWVGDKFKTYKEATRKIDNGDPKLLEKFKKAEETTLQTPLATRATYLPSTEGLYFSIPAFIEGEPEHWLQEVEEEAPGKAGDLYINMSAPSFTTPEEIINKLLFIAKLVDEAELKGQRLNIYIMVIASPSKNNPHKEKITFQVKIKDQSDPVNRQQLVYLIANPVLFRLGFLLLNSERVGSHFGEYLTQPEDEESYLNDEQIIYIPSFYHDIKNRNKPLPGPKNNLPTS
jgi:hypothetical protein